MLRLWRRIALVSKRIVANANHVRKDFGKSRSAAGLSQGNGASGGKARCPGPGGKPWPPDNLSTAFAAFVRQSEIKHLRFHDLRHTHATQLLKEGVHPKVVSERLGHSTVAITLDTYSHVLPGMQKDAVARLDTALRSALARGSET